MTKTNKLLFGLACSLFGIILVILAFIAGIAVGEKNAQKAELNSRSIYEKLTSSALLTSKIAYIDQKSTITVDSESEWSKLLWGQTITSNGLMKVSIGVDLQKLQETNISVDTASKRIVIGLPAPQILNTELEGDIETVNQQGILKLLLANDPDTDYNLALNQLKKDANTAVTSDPDIFNLAFSETTNIITNFYKGTGYTVVINKL